MKDKSTARTIKIDGNEIYYWVTEVPEAKNTLVMHPGAGMNHTAFEPLERLLNKQGNNTVNFDQRGVGYSKVPYEPKQFTLEKFSRDLQTIIEQEKLVKPSLLAHSFGFMPAVDYASRSQNVADITGVCGSPKFSETSFPGAAWIFGNLMGYTDYLACGITAIPHLLKGENRVYSDQSNLESNSPINDLKVWAAIGNVPFREIRAHTLTNKSLSGWDVKEQLGKIQSPIHIILGSKDIFVYPDTSDKVCRYSGGLVTSDVLVGTHSLPYSHPQAVAEVFKNYH